MKSWKAREAAHRRALELARRAAQSERRSHTLPRASATDSTEDDPTVARAKQVITDWLARLDQLYGVPFEYLVPDYRMLPPESIRWAFLDPNWLARANDGALSVGRQSTFDALLDRQFEDEIASSVSLAVPLQRSKLRGVPLPQDVSVGGTLAVLLIRSALVSGYPGLEVKATNSAGHAVQLVRMDHLAADVLLVIFAELPAEVELVEPAEGLHFGVREENGAPTTLLRSLQPGSLGRQVTNDGTAVAVNLAWRNDDPTLGVLDIAASCAAIGDALQRHDGWPAGKSLGSGELAIEMVRAPGLQRFVPNTSGGEEP